MPRNHNPLNSPRNRTGLRNRKRGGRGTYSLKGKRKTADFYGKYENGVQKQPERIAR